MEIPDKITFAAQRLREGHRINRVTVRDFLRHFGAERRGAAKVEEIRRVLDSLELTTEPDFEIAWIDAPIRLLLKAGVATTAGPAFYESGNRSEEDSGAPDDVVLEGTPSAVKQAEEQTESAPTSAEPDTAVHAEVLDYSSTDDPTFRIGSLPAANRKLIVVNQDDSLTKAVTLMLQYDFSQLPVMQSTREVKGVISWKSIGAKHALGHMCSKVGECREDARIIDSKRTLFEAISIIDEYGYVLVRAQDRRITGIVTSSDLSQQFQIQTEPFLLLREIELYVRRLLTGKICASDFELLGSSGAGSKKKPQSIADLTFGQYQRLFQHPQIWAKLNLKIDSIALDDLLETVRLIRNDVMHFNPDPMTPDQLGLLKRAVRFMQRLDDFLPKAKSAIAIE
jgi:predicted transcriptional regulator